MMASPRTPVNTVCLPVFAGYTQFALWPAPQLVSYYNFIHIDIISISVYNIMLHIFNFSAECVLLWAAGY